MYSPVIFRGLFLADRRYLWIDVCVISFFDVFSVAECLGFLNWSRDWTRGHYVSATHFDQCLYPLGHSTKSQSVTLVNPSRLIKCHSTWVNHGDDPQLKYNSVNSWWGGGWKALWMSSAGTSLKSNCYGRNFCLLDLILKSLYSHVIVTICW